MCREFYVEPKGCGGWIVQNNGFVIGAGAEPDMVEMARRLAFSEWRHVRVPSQVHVRRPDGCLRTDWVFGDIAPRHP